MSAQVSAVQTAPEVRERNFYFGMGIACTLIVFVGFAPTFFLSPFFERPATAAPWSIFLQLHAAIFTAWIALFVTQTALVRADRRDLHRRLGILGLVLGVAIVTINSLTVVDAIAAGRTSSIGPPIPRLWLALSASLIAGGFILAGMYWRRNREAHKRLMLLATINMIGPAMNRLTRELDLTAVLGMERGSISFAAILALCCACIVNDYARRRRVHAVYVVGVGVLFASRGLSAVVPGTDAWRVFASWMIG